VNSIKKLNGCVLVKLSYAFADSLKPFLRQGCKRVEVLSIEVLAIDKCVHSYTVVVVLPDAVPERPKVLQVHPVGCAVPNPPEQHNGRTQIVSHMVVIMENTFAQVIYIYVLVFFILDHLAEEERDIFQVIPVYILH